MNYVCDACFDLNLSGSMTDVPNTDLPTNPTPCSICQTLIIQGIELTGHWVQSIPYLVQMFPILTGSR